MTKDEWENFTVMVRDTMAKFVFPRITPIAYAPPGTTEARAHGTGNYVSVGEGTYLLTNEHVAANGSAGLAHLPGPTDDYVRLAGVWHTVRPPYDVALLRLWNGAPPSERPRVEAGMFDDWYQAEPDELLFWVGHPGTLAKRHEPVTKARLRYNWFGGPLETPAIPILTIGAPEAPQWLGDFDPEVQVAVHFPGVAWRSAAEPESVLPNPKGMSGSLLWDTKAVASFRRGERWSPAMARVCGLVQMDYPRHELIVATRVENVREAIRHVVLEERAYARWEVRGRPLGDADADWHAAEASTQEI